MRTLRRRRLLAYGLATAASGAVAAACGAERAPIGRTPQPARTSRLALAWWIDTGFPSPFAFSALGPGGVVRVSLLFDSLAWKDQNGVVPWLATSWEIPEDGQDLVFTLRPGVQWHDGRPFGAEDVAFSFGYYGAHPFSWADTSVVDSARAIDAQRVSVRLKRPFAPFVHDVAGVLPVVPRHIWANVDDPLKRADPTAAVGTGPFILQSYAEEHGAYLFGANPRFFAGRPAFDQLSYEVVPIEQEPVVLQSGRLHGALAMDFAVQQKFQSGRYRVLATQPFSVVRLVFNVQRPPFDRVEFRQALAYALDRRQIGERVAHGDVVVGSAGVIPPESPWFSANVTQYPFDPTRAAAMLDALGYTRGAAGQPRQTPQGAPLRVQLLADPNAADAELVQSMLSQVGIGVDLVTADPKTRTDRLQKLDFQMGLLQHIGVGGDPDFLRRWYAGQTANGFAQGNVLGDPAYTRLAEQQAAALDVEKRHGLVAEMQRLLSDDLPTLPLYYRRFYWIYDPRANDRWFNTWGGLMTGIPLADNKLALLRR